MSYEFTRIKDFEEWLTAWESCTTESAAKGLIFDGLDNMFGHNDELKLATKYLEIADYKPADALGFSARVDAEKIRTQALKCLVLHLSKRARATSRSGIGMTAYLTKQIQRENDWVNIPRDGAIDFVRALRSFFAIQPDDSTVQGSGHNREIVNKLHFKDQRKHLQLILVEILMLFWLKDHHQELDLQDLTPSEMEELSIYVYRHFPETWIEAFVKPPRAQPLRLEFNSGFVTQPEIKASFCETFLKDRDVDELFKEGDPIAILFKRLQTS